MDDLAALLQKAFRTLEENRGTHPDEPVPEVCTSPEFRAWQRQEAIKNYRILAQNPAKRWGGHSPSLSWKDGEMPKPDQYFREETILACGEEIQRIYDQAVPSTGRAKGNKEEY